MVRHGFLGVSQSRGCVSPHLKVDFLLNIKTPLQLLFRLATVFLMFSVVLSFSSLAQNLDRLPRQDPPRIFLLGEIHDNPSGHQLRMDLVMQLILQGPNPIVAMEQFDRENQAALNLALTECQDVDCVLAGLTPKDLPGAGKNIERMRLKLAKGSPFA